MSHDAMSEFMRTLLCTTAIPLSRALVLISLRAFISDSHFLKHLVSRTTFRKDHASFCHLRSLLSRLNRKKFIKRCAGHPTLDMMFSIRNLRLKESCGGKLENDSLNIVWSIHLRTLFKSSCMCPETMRPSMPRDKCGCTNKLPRLGSPKVLSPPRVASHSFIGAP